jgi:hypothetical protein
MVKFDLNALKRFVTAPLRMNRKQAVILLILLTIFAGAFYLRLSTLLSHGGLPTGKDGPYYLFHVKNLLEHYPSDPLLGDPPVFFHFATWISALFSRLGASLLTSLSIATALASAFIVLTIFLMVRKLTKNVRTALLAAFFSAFVSASIQTFAEFQKNMFGVTLTPLSVFFFWRGLENGKKLNLIVAGVLLGVIGLTHQLAFGTLAIAYVSYLAFLLAYRRRIPWPEIKAMLILAIPAAAICGYFYYTRLGGLGGMGGGSTTIVLQQPSPPLAPQELSVYMNYDTFIGKPLLMLAAFGAGVAIYRRRASDLFLLAWGMSAFMMAQPWVAQDYQWRFVLMLAPPTALFAALGLVEGIGALLWRTEKLRMFISRGQSRKQEKPLWMGRIALLALLASIVVYQANTSYTLAGTSPILQPTITMEEYNSMEEFRETFGSVYVFGKGDKFHYWPDAVGLKGVIQAGENVESLARILAALGPQDAMILACEWYQKQNLLGENIYALESTAEPAEILENQGLFVLVFTRSSLRAYALKENFRPPGGPPPGSSSVLLAEGPPPPDNRPPPKSQPAPGQAPTLEPVLKILLAPIYLLPSTARFVAGVPIMVMVWAFFPCLLWSMLQKKIPRGKLERLRKILVIGLVVSLVLAFAFFIGQPLFGPSPGGPPGQ